MKKRILTLVLTLLLLFGVFSVAQADPPLPKNGAQVVINRENSCFWIGDPGNSFYLAEGRTQSVLTPNGKWKLTCIGETVIADPPLTKALTVSCTAGQPNCGFCTVEAPGISLQTQEFKMVFSPGGKSHVSCWGDASP